jgi:hypothetical protein
MVVGSALQNPAQPHIDETGPVPLCAYVARAITLATVVCVQPPRPDGVSTPLSFSAQAIAA